MKKKIEQRLKIEDTLFEMGVGYYKKIIIRVPDITSQDNINKAIEYLKYLRDLK